MSASNEDRYLAAFGKRFAEIRRKQGFTQESLAEKVGVTSLSISFIEQGRRWPRLNTLHKFAKSLKVPISELFKGL
jgi:transcriptional regulator with XRE-family HTH domain